MGTLGMIGCNTLADEIAYLLFRDRQIAWVFVISNPEGVAFIARKINRLLADRTSLVQESDLGHLEPAPGFKIVLWVIPSSLHTSPSSLHRVLEDTTARMSCSADSIFIVHGLCGIHRREASGLIEKAKVPVNFLTYPDGEIADDCFGSLIGSREGYLDFIKKHKFAMFVHGGYAEYMMGKHEDLDLMTMVTKFEELEFVLSTLGFKTIVKLEADVGDAGEFDRTVNILSRTLGLEIVSLSCELSVFENSYDLGKRNAHHAMRGVIDEFPGLI